MPDISRGIICHTIRTTITRTIITQTLTRTITTGQTITLIRRTAPRSKPTRCSWHGLVMTMVPFTAFLDRPSVIRWLRVNRQLGCHQASVVRQECRIAKFVNVTDNRIDQTVGALIEMGMNAFLQTFNAKLAAILRLDFNDAVGEK